MSRRLGGEGLMLRQPGSKYEAGRSSTLLKIKSFRDADAVVLGHQAGEGRHKGRLGALLVRLPSGIEFAVGTGFSDKERSAPPPVGATITFRYQELSDGGVPRFPSYVGVRADAPVVAAAAAASRAVASPAAKIAGAVVSVGAPQAQGRGKSPGGSAQPRYFEFVDGKSSKFWEVSQSGCEMTTRWGRIGTDGQSKNKSFADAGAAADQMEKLIEQKSGEGYVEKTRSA